MATLRSESAANQPPPLAGHDLFASNRPLAEALEREGAGWAAERCSVFGCSLTQEPLEWGRLANEQPPRLRTHDRFGERVDEVEFHPAWHELMRMSIAHGVRKRSVCGRSTTRGIRTCSPAASGSGSRLPGP